jgi:hypothetical protein
MFGDGGTTEEWPFRRLHPHKKGYATRTSYVGVWNEEVRLLKYGLYAVYGATV